MPRAEILSIGTELLLGEIVDTNAAVIARALREAGIDLFRKTVIGDNATRIATAICEALSRSEILITTGGLGPTIDDATREAVAQAVGTDLEYRADLWAQIEERFHSYGRQPTENNRRQAYIPRGSEPIFNPYGTAPAFLTPFPSEKGERLIFSLPGVPREMEPLLASDVIPTIVRRFSVHGTIKTRILHTAGLGESHLDSLVGDLETMVNPTVGLAAHAGQVDVRITAKADSEAEADRMIAPVEADLRSRLSKWIYGADGETLEQIALDALAQKGWRVAVVEAGIGGELLHRLSEVNGASAGSFAGGQLYRTIQDKADLPALTAAARQSFGTEAALGAALFKKEKKYELILTLITPVGEQNIERSYGGPPGYAPRFAAHAGLDLLRRMER